MQVQVLRLGWNPKASTPRLVDRLFRQREQAAEAASAGPAPAPTSGSGGSGPGSDPR
jgi:hypothetical protein